MVLNAAPVLEGLDAHRLLSLDFEDLVATPRAALSAIDRYLFADGTTDIDKWVAQSASILVSSRASWSDGLTQAERRRLELTCRPGMKWLYGASSSSRATASPEILQ